MSRKWSAGVSREALKRAGIELQPGDLGSELEGDLANILHLSELPRPERECVLIPGRQWRSDFVWRDARVIVEVEGGTHSQGRHVRGKGFADDCRKYAALTLAGWLVLRVTGEHIKSGEALDWIERALEQRRGEKP